jgi:hypothetical protein
MGKVFPHLSRRKLKAARFQPLILEPEDPERRRARVAAERREAERIQAERRRRMLERSAARASRDPSDLDATWFAAHPDRSHRVRRAVADEIPAHLDQRRWKWMAIRQLEPGLRIRLPLNMPYTRMLLDLIADEEGARTVFDMAVEARAGLPSASVEEAIAP